MKTSVRLLIAAALLAGCANPLEPEKQSYYSGTIPIAQGNTWFYQHYHSTTRPFYTFEYQHTQYRNSVFVVSIDSVSSHMRGDSVLFRVTTGDSTIDSSDFNDLFAESFSYFNSDSTMTWSAIAVAFPPIVYEKHTVAYYLCTKNSLFVRDTGTGFWKPDSGSFLSYKGQPDSSYNVQHIGLGDLCFDYYRHSYSAAVVINSRDTGKLNTTEIAQTRHSNNDHINGYDTLQWIENTGLYYKCGYGNYVSGTSYSQTSIDKYSLISFNGSPITVSQ
jgi:hypothetical protein